MTVRRRYMIYGIVVDSEFPLATVGEAVDLHSPASVRLELGTAEFFSDKARGLCVPPEDWIQHAVLDDGSVFIKVKGILQTVVSADGRTAVCAWLEDADRTAVEANFLNFVLSTSLTLQGEEPFHATVVDLGDKVVGLLGPSGAGKSTLAACLIGQGADLVTDDMLRLQLIDGTPFVHHGPYRLKLLDDSARQFLPRAAKQGYFNVISGKTLVRPRETMPDFDEARQLDALFWVGDHEADPSAPVSVHRLSGIRLAKVLIASTMNWRYDAPNRLERQLRFAERVADVLPVYSLEYPRSFEVMDRVADEVRRVASA
jgi:energy-coupling factor transporter ATP-binding protein EcfA2